MASSKDKSSRAAVPSIAFEELKARVAAGDLTLRQAQAYFVPSARSTAFRPSFKLARSLVTVTGKSPSADEIDELVMKLDDVVGERAAAARQRSASRTRMPPGDAKTATKSAAKKIKVLAEGDSWFDLPNWFPTGYPKDAMDYFGQSHDLVNVAKWKATLAGMIKDKQYVQKLDSPTRYQCFFFSGGGNDVLGEIDDYLLPRKAGDTDPKNAHKYVDGAFAGKVNSVLSKYRTLVADVKSTSAANVITFLHGYANAVPVPGGESLGIYFEAKGFDTITHRPLCKAIVARMVDAFNDGLQAIASQNARFVYVDLRDVIGDGDWHNDEIHPNSNGARKISAEFARQVRQAIPSA